MYKERKPKKGKQRNQKSKDRLANKKESILLRVDVNKRYLWLAALFLDYRAPDFSDSPA